MAPYISPNGRVIHGAHVEQVAIKVGGRQVSRGAHVMVWWLTAGVAKGLTGQYSMN
jgi:hypothetical protein